MSSNGHHTTKKAQSLTRGRKTETAVDRDLFDQMNVENNDLASVDEEKDLVSTGELNVLDVSGSGVLEISPWELEPVDSQEVQTPLGDTPQPEAAPAAAMPRHARPTLSPHEALNLQQQEINAHSLIGHLAADPGLGQQEISELDDSPELENAPTRIEREEDIRAALETNAPVPTAKLTIIGGNNRGKDFALHLGDNSIGRGMDNDIILADIAVSRKHTLVCFEENQFIVRDLGSGNGTLLNGARAESAPLHDGDQLELGNTLLRFVNPLPAAQLSQLETVVTHRDHVDELIDGLPQASQPVLDVGLADRPKSAHPHITAIAQAKQTSKLSLTLRDLWMEMINTPTRKTLFFGACGLIAFLMVLVGIKALISSKKQPPPPVQIQTAVPPDELVAQAFNAGITQYNAHNWDKAKAHFLKALRIAPSHEYVRQYVEKCLLESQAKIAIDQAHQSLARKDFPGARKQIAQISSNSVYHKEASTLAQKIDTVEVEKLLETANELKIRGDLDGALTQLKKAQEIAPTSQAVKDLAATLSRAPTHHAKAHHAPAPPLSPRPQPRLQTRPQHKSSAPTSVASAPHVKTALSLYGKRQWSAAYQAFKAYADKLPKHKQASAYAMASAMQKTGQSWDNAQKTTKMGQRVKYYQQALTYDKKVSGSPHQGPLKDALLKTVKSHATACINKGKWAEAYSMVRMGHAIRRTDPDLASFMKILEDNALKLFTKGYAIRNSNMAQARSLWQTVLRMVPPSSETYKKAYSYLNSSGPSYQDEDEE